MSAGGDRDPVARYGAYVLHERRLSALTWTAYRRDLDALRELAGETPLEAIGVDDIRRYVAQLHGRGLSGRSLARMLSAWRGFYDWLVRERTLTTNPCGGTKAPRSPKRLPAALSPDAAARLVELPGDDALAVRDRAILELLYSSGLRLAEVAGLDIAGVDLAAGLVTVVGKGGKARVVPMGEKAVAAVRRWLEARPAFQRGAGQALFLARTGNRLARRTIEQVTSRRGRQQGLEEGVHPHKLRHSMASHVLQSSGDLRAVQEMLGHASIASTQVYTHLDFQHLAKVYDAAHPRAKVRKKSDAPTE